MPGDAVATRSRRREPRAPDLSTAWNRSALRPGALAIKLHYGEVNRCSGPTENPEGPEVEERHHRGDSVSVVNSLTVFEFDHEGLIRHLDVFLQQPR